MASSTYTERAIVLGKTKLGESDVIVRMLGSRGSLLEGVAKGARKPQSSLSGRLELFNTVDVHCAEGKSLDVVKDARLVEAHGLLHTDPAYSSSAACIAEFASKTAQPDLEVGHLFDLTETAFGALSKAGVAQLPMVVSAYIFKASAFLGMRPSFDRCVSCGAVVSDEGGQARFSYMDGGVFCSDCAGFAETVCAPFALMAWGQRLLRSRFDEMLDMECDPILGTDLLKLSEQWTLTHMGTRLKSVPQAIAFCAEG